MQNKRFRQSYSFFGADRLLFATDYPYPGDVGLKAVIKAVGRMSITEEKKARIFSKNAQKLLKIS